MAQAETEPQNVCEAAYKDLADEFQQTIADVKKKMDQQEHGDLQLA